MRATLNNQHFNDIHVCERDYKVKWTRFESVRVRKTNTNFLIFYLLSGGFWTILSIWIAFFAKMRHFVMSDKNDRHIIFNFYN